MLRRYHGERTVAPASAADRRVRAFGDDGAEKDPAEDPAMTDWSRGAAWMGGEILPIDEARLPVTDWALTHADAVYDVVPVREGRFFRLGDHLDRFEASMAAARLAPGVGRATLADRLHAIVARAGLRAAYVAMVAARGQPLVPGMRDPRQCANHLFCWCVPYVHVIPEDVAARGARLKIAATVRRIPEDCVDPRAKNYHWGDFTAGLFEAKDAGFDTVVLPDHAGNLTEGPGFNIFAVRDGRVATPDRGVLEGITRRTVLEICAALGIPSEVRALPAAEALEADEIFTATSGGGVTGVAALDGRSFGDGAAGPVTQRIAETFHAWRRRPDLTEPVRGLAPSA